MNQGTSKDVDLEVYQFTEAQLEAVLKQFSTVYWSFQSRFHLAFCLYVFPF